MSITTISGKVEQIFHEQGLEDRVCIRISGTLYTAFVDNEMLEWLKQAMLKNHLIEIAAFFDSHWYFGSIRNADLGKCYCIQTRKVTRSLVCQIVVSLLVCALAGVYGGVLASTFLDSYIASVVVLLATLGLWVFLASSLSYSARNLIKASMVFRSA